MGEQFFILLIEDNPHELSSIRQSFEDLKNQEFECIATICNTLNKALVILDTPHAFDLIVTNIYLPDKKGLETIQCLHEAAPTIPIIATSPFAQEHKIREMIRFGAQDYLPQNDLDLTHLQKAIYCAIERNNLQQALRALSFTDELTRVYNRRGFFTLLEQQLSLCKRNHQGFYLLIVDLDYLKSINDTYGHPAGDQALKDTALCLKQAFRHHDIIGRIGGDEFAIIAVNASVGSHLHLKQNVTDAVHKLNTHSSNVYKLSLSIGTAYFSKEISCSADELMHQADRSLYKEKKLSHG